MTKMTARPPIMFAGMASNAPAKMTTRDMMMGAMIGTPSSNGIRKGILPFFCSAGLGRHSKAVAELGMMTSWADNGFPMRLVTFLTPVNVAFIAFVNQRTNPQPSAVRPRIGQGAYCEVGDWPGRTIGRPCTPD